MTETPASAVRAREDLESVIWHHLPARLPHAAGLVDILLSAADAFAVRGSAGARARLGDTWRRLCPQGRPEDAGTVMLAADRYAAISVAAELTALEPSALRAARRDDLAEAARRRGRGHLELAAGEAVTAADRPRAQCGCGRQYDHVDAEGKHRCTECRRRQAREAMTRHRARKRAGRLPEAA